MFFTLLIIIITLIAILLTLVVLLQSGKGGGLAGMAGGGATRQVLGARQAPDLLERATWTLAAVFIVLCILTNFAIDTGGAQESIIQQRSGEQTQQPALPPAQQQGQPLDQAPQGQQQSPPAPVPDNTPEDDQQ